MIGGGFVYVIQRKFFYVLVLVADSKYIGIKTYWFGLVWLEFNKSHEHKVNIC